MPGVPPPPADPTDSLQTSHPQNSDPEDASRPKIARRRGPQRIVKKRAKGQHSKALVRDMYGPEAEDAGVPTPVEGTYADGPVFSPAQLRQLHCQVQAHAQLLLQSAVLFAQPTLTDTQVRPLPLGLLPLYCPSTP